MKKKITAKNIDKLLNVPNPFLDNYWNELAKQKAKKLDDAILDEIAKVFKKYGIWLNKDLFMEVCREYFRRKEETE